MTKTYSEMARLRTFMERFEYLKLNGAVGVETFGSRRYLNQVFYTSSEWRKVRDQVIIRDDGCDLGVPGIDIPGHIYIHHIVPITAEDIEMRRSWIFDPEFLVCVSFRTHEAIHYGDANLLIHAPAERSAGDTRLW